MLIDYIDRLPVPKDSKDLSEDLESIHKQICAAVGIPKEFMPFEKCKDLTKFICLKSRQCDDNKKFCIDWRLPSYDTINETKKEGN